MSHIRIVHSEERTMMISRLVSAVVVLIILLSCATAPAWADRDRKDKDRRIKVIKIDRDHKVEKRHRSNDRRIKIKKNSRGHVLDKRHRHDRRYPRRGHVSPRLPRGHHSIPHRGKRYYHHHGVWYRRSGVSFVVVLPPVGITVPVLPPFYTTIWVGSVPYYYANGVYYVWRPVERVYVVTDRPPESEVSEQPTKTDRLFVYPKKGQSEQRQASDRYQCYRWSVDQTGFDPTRSGGNVPEAQYYSKRSDYHRAMKACLEARGYSVQ